MWILYALGSSFFAGVTAVLAKCGIKRTDSTVATAIRTVVVLLFSWLMVCLVTPRTQLSLPSGKTLCFLILSGLCTGASWLCYFRALQLGRINPVMVVDKSSTVLTVLFSFLFLQEPFTWWKGFGVVLLAMGTFLMLDLGSNKHKDSHAPETQQGAQHTMDSSASQKECLDTNSQPQESIPSSEKRTAACMPTISVTDTSVQNAKSSQDSFNQSVQTMGTIEDGMSGKPIAPAQTADLVNKAEVPQTAVRRATFRWLPYAVGSAVFAALTSILGKVGIVGVESNFGTALRTGVVLLMAWLMIPLTNKGNALRAVPRNELGFICLSGIATGASWLCFYKALQGGPAGAVSAVDKCSILFTVLFSRLFFGERLTKTGTMGLIAMMLGTLTLLF